MELNWADFAIFICRLIQPFFYVCVLKNNGRPVTRADERGNVRVNLRYRNKQMKAYYEIETDIPVNHQLKICLPDNIPAGRAKVAVIYEINEATTKQMQMAAFLNTLPDNQAGDLSRDDIQAFIHQERESWND